MYGYNKKENQFGALLARAGIDVLSVCNIGRTYTVDVAPHTDTATLAAVSLGRRNTQFIGADVHKDLRTGATVLRATFSPKL